MTVLQRKVTALFEQSGTMLYGISENETGNENVLAIRNTIPYFISSRKVYLEWKKWSSDLGTRG